MSPSLRSGWTHRSSNAYAPFCARLCHPGAAPHTYWNVSLGSSSGSPRFSVRFAHHWLRTLISMLFLPTMTALDPQRWSDLRAKLSSDLRLLHHIGLAALPPGSRILRIGQSCVSSLAELPLHPVDSRRIWIQSVAPHTGLCVLSEESVLVLGLWLDLAESGTACRSLIRPPRLDCEAFADACATPTSAGLGGFVRLPDGRQLFFRNKFSRDELPTCSRGCHRRLRCRASSLLGSCWLNVRLCTSSTCSWATVTYRFTAFSVATTLLQSPVAGKVFPWLLVSVLCFAHSFCCSSVTVSPSTSIMCLASLMMLLTR